MKSIFQSKTFWFAVAKAVAGIFVVFGTQYPDMLGWMITGSSMIDMVLRSITKEPVKAI